MLRGDDTLARRLFEQAATALTPSTRYLAHLFLGSMDERDGDPASAERHYLAALGAFPLRAEWPPGAWGAAGAERTHPGSRRRRGPHPARQKDGARAALEALRADERAALIAFNHVITPATAWTSDREPLTSVITTLKAHGSTSLFDAALAASCCAIPSRDAATC
jgi:hypothetical protein